MVIVGVGVVVGGFKTLVTVRVRLVALGTEAALISTVREDRLETEQEADTVLREHELISVEI